MDNIRYEADGGVGILTITRAKQLNALNKQTLDELKEALEGLGNIRCLVVTGEGQKAFVGGADISEMADMDAEQAKAFSKAGSAVFSKIEDLRIPVIAAVNGYALGGGCELALCCDVIIAAQSAVFAQPEVKLGVIPGFGGTRRLARKIGQSRAMLMILTGEYVNAARALEAGLADRLCDGDALKKPRRLRARSRNSRRRQSCLPKRLCAAGKMKTRKACCLLSAFRLRSKKTPCAHFSKKKVIKKFNTGGQKC